MNICRLCFTLAATMEKNDNPYLNMSMAIENAEAAGT